MEQRPEHLSRSTLCQSSCDSTKPAIGTGLCHESSAVEFHQRRAGTLDVRRPRSPPPGRHCRLHRPRAPCRSRKRPVCAPPWGRLVRSLASRCRMRRGFWFPSCFLCGSLDPSCVFGDDSWVLRPSRPLPLEAQERLPGRLPHRRPECRECPIHCPMLPFWLREYTGPRTPAGVSTPTPERHNAHRHHPRQKARSARIPDPDGIANSSIPCPSRWENHAAGSDRSARVPARGGYWPPCSSGRSVHGPA